MEGVRSVVVFLLTINYLFLAPWIIFSIPAAAFFQQRILLAGVIAAVGLTGMVRGNRNAALLASVGLMLALIWGKIAGDVYGLPSPDTAMLLFQFLSVISLMEGSSTVLTFRTMTGLLAGMNDEVSFAARARMVQWISTQLKGIGEMTIGAFLLSLALLVLGSTLSVSTSHVALTGILVLSAVVAMMFLLTYRREPESGTGPH